VFSSGGVFSLAALRGCESSAWKRKTDTPAQRISGVFLSHISAAATGNAWLVVAAVGTAALGDRSLDNLYQRVTMSTDGPVPLESLFDDEIDLVLRELGEHWQ
jgi:hypothetical protein